MVILALDDRFCLQIGNSERFCLVESCSSRTMLFPHSSSSVLLKRLALSLKKEPNPVQNRPCTLETTQVANARAHEIDNMRVHLRLSQAFFCVATHCCTGFTTDPCECPLGGVESQPLQSQRAGNDLLQLEFETRWDPAFQPLLDADHLSMQSILHEAFPVQSSWHLSHGWIISHSCRSL